MRNLTKTIVSKNWLVHKIVDNKLAIIAKKYAKETAAPNNIENQHSSKDMRMKSKNPLSYHFNW